MPNLNKVLLMGHLCADLEPRTVGDTTVARARLAIDDSYKNKNGDKVEQAVFVDVDIWGRQAETTAQYCGKGSAVFIEGRLQLDSWDDKETGEKRTKLKVRAERVQFIKSSKPGGGDAAQDNQSPPAAPRKDESQDTIPF